MVIFDDLRITDSGQKLLIDCHIENVDEYSGMYIDTIYLEYYKNVQSLEELSGKEYTVYAKLPAGDALKTARFAVDFADVIEAVPDFGADSFAGGLFNILVCCEGTADGVEATATDIGIALDWDLLYNYGMNYVSALTAMHGSPCNDTAELEQFILLWFALRIALDAMDYTQTVYVWDKFLHNYNGMSVASVPCNCR